MLDLNKLAKDLRHDTELPPEVKDILAYCVGKALSLERGNKSLRAEINNKQEQIAKLQRKVKG